MWIWKLEDKTTFCSYCTKKVDKTNSGESPLKWHAGLASFEDKSKNCKLRTPFCWLWELFWSFEKSWNGNGDKQFHKEEK